MPCVFGGPRVAAEHAPEIMVPPTSAKEELPKGAATCVDLRDRRCLHRRVDDKGGLAAMEAGAPSVSGGL